MAALAKLPHSSSIRWLDKESIPIGLARPLALTATEPAQEAGPERSRGCDIRSDRTAESRCPCQGRTSLPRPQAAIWLHEDAIPWLEEEHRSDHDPVCTGQSVDGAQGFTERVTSWKKASRPSKRARCCDEHGPSSCQKVLDASSSPTTKESARKKRVMQTFLNSNRWELPDQSNHVKASYCGKTEPAQVRQTRILASPH
ncbi:hypothetical protein QF000_007900 [Paraburkholderia atlantica]